MGRAVHGQQLHLSKWRALGDHSPISVKSVSSPWEIHPFLRTANHLFQWAIYTMAMLNNQGVTSNSILYVTVSSLDGSPGVQ